MAVDGAGGVFSGGVAGRFFSSSLTARGRLAGASLASFSAGGGPVRNSVVAARGPDDFRPPHFMCPVPQAEPFISMITAWNMTETDRVFRPVMMIGTPKTHPVA